MPKTVVHALHHGFPLCGFSMEVPKRWPRGHKWVNTWQLRQITCKECKAKAEELAVHE